MNSLRTFTLGDLVAAARRSGGRLDLVTADRIVNGDNGFVAKGLVARVVSDTREPRYVVTERGAELSAGLHEWQVAA